MDDCIFCRIASGDIPSDFVLEDADFVAFRDLHPKAPQHVLVVPRAHIASLNDFESPVSLIAGLGATLKHFYGS